MTDEIKHKQALKAVLVAIEILMDTLPDTIESNTTPEGEFLNNLALAVSAYENKLYPDFGKKPA